VAKQVEDIVVRLIGEGFEALDKIKGSFRELGKVTGFTETEIARLRKEVLTFDSGLGKSTQTLRGQIDALKGLQGQAVINSVSYRQLGNDLKKLGGAYKEAASGVKTFTDAQRASQFVGAKPATFDPQIAALKRQLQELNIYERQYTEKLTEIQRRQLPFNAAVGRQNVIAGFQTYQQGGMNLGQALPELPNTNAALAQSIQELTNKFANLTRGTKEWREASKELKSLSRQSAEGFDVMSAGAREAKTRLDALRTSLKQVGSGFAEFSRNPLALTQAAEGQTAVQKSIERNRRKRGLLGVQVSNMPFGPAEPTELFRGIANIQGQSNSNQLQLMGRSYSEVATSIRQTSAASDSSLNSLRAQRAAWESLRDTLSGNKTAMRDVDKELAQLDRRIERQGVGGGRRLTGSQLAQGVGAALSGGIFGGPEGLIGGLGGLAFGGVGGAFAGAAAGAQVGMFRQQLAGTADYAASIGKLQIALRGVVGSQEAYDAAIRAAAAATRDLNIPQEEATRGLTRLSAAVIGAGGTVADSSFAFRAMSEAIKATGGNAEQVDGALLALTQVFSKGKVSAEELNQIAERLPGTFTLFAQAAGKTGPELQKALEQGEVGLNDLMKFLALTSKRYGTTALEIAASSQDAGARLTVAFQAMRLEVGKALQPLGAELQETFTAFIKDITPAVVGSAKALAAAISFFTDNKAAAGLATFALQAGAVALALKALGLLLGPVSQGLALMGVAFGKTSAQAVVAQGRLAAFGATVKTLAKAVSGPILITIALVGAELVINYFNRIKAARDGLVKTTSQATGGQWLQEIGGNALGQEALTRAINDVGKAYAIASDKANQLRRERDRLNKVAGGPGGAATIAASVQLDRAAAELKAAEAEVKLLESRYKAGITRLPNAPKPVAASTGTNFPDPTGGEDTKDKAADKTARDAEAAAAEQQRQNEAIAKAKIALDDAVFRNDMELIRKKYEYEQELEGKKRDLVVKSQTGAARETAGLISGFLGELQTLTNRLTEAGQGVETATQELKSAKAMATTTISPTGAVSAAGRYMQGGIGPKGPNQYGPHFDIKRSDGGFYSRTALDPYVQVNGRPLSRGVTVPGGEYGAPRSYGGHAGRDYAFGGSAAMTLTGGAKWVGNQKGSYGDAAAFMTPDGKVYKVIHGKFEGTATAGRQPTGVATAIRRDIAAEGEVSTAEANLDKAKTAQALTAKQIEDLTAVAGKSFVLDFTDALRQQNAALEDTASITELRNKLQLAGERPETIDAEIRKAEAIQRSTQQTDLAAKALKALDDAGLGGSVAATTLRDGIAAQNAEIAKFKKLTDAATTSQIAFNDAMRMRQDDRIGLGMQEGARAYVESVGTMRDATAQLTQTGIKGVEDALSSLVTTGTANFREFAAEILKQSARMILQLTIQRVIMQIIGAISGAPANPSAPGGDWMAAVGRMNSTSNYAKGAAFAANNIVPYAMGGAFTNSVVSKPTLFKFAQGGTMRTGLMGEAGPEAIMPLSRGANGKLGVASTGGSAPVSVTVNVDASGNSQVAGDQNQGAQLGRVIAGAVQQELIKQRRPGGLLA
jgi:lambda family phage tail tape measure protein